MRLNKILFDQIEQEREGEQIDRALLKNVLDIFVEIGMGQMDQYENDFEAAMLKATAAYYSQKASNWILEDSCPDYMLKVSFFCLYYIWLKCNIFICQIISEKLKFQAEECLRREKEKVSHYLHSSSEPKLLEVCISFHDVILFG